MVFVVLGSNPGRAREDRQGYEACEWKYKSSKSASVHGNASPVRAPTALQTHSVRAVFGQSHDPSHVSEAVLRQRVE